MLTPQSLSFGLVANTLAARRVSDASAFSAVRERPVRDAVYPLVRRPCCYSSATRPRPCCYSSATRPRPCCYSSATRPATVLLLARCSSGDRAATRPLPESVRRAPMRAPSVPAVPLCQWRASFFLQKNSTTNHKPQAAAAPPPPRCPPPALPPMPPLPPLPPIIDRRVPRPPPTPPSARARQQHPYAHAHTHTDLSRRRRRRRCRAPRSYSYLERRTGERGRWSHAASVRGKGDMRGKSR